jgi:IS1 family transposase
MIPSDQTIAEWHTALKAYARQHYTQGWDVYVECFDQSDLKSEIKYLVERPNSTFVPTLESIKQVLERQFLTRQEYEDDIRAEAF